MRLRRAAVRITWLLLAAMTVGLAMGISRLGFDDRYSAAFRSTDREFQTFQEFAEHFGAGEDDCVLLVEGADVLSLASLLALRELHIHLDELAGVDSVVSIFAIRKAERIGRYFLPLFPAVDALTQDGDLDEFRSVAARHPLIRDRLLTEDQQAQLFLVRLDRDHRSLEASQRVIEAIRGEISRVEAAAPVTFGLTGIPVIRLETIRNLQRDNQWITLMGVGMATLVAWFWMGRLGQVVAAVGPALLGVVWCLGFMGWGGKNLDAICVILPALWLVIGVSDSVHLIEHIRQRREAGWEASAAAWDAVRHLGSACFLTSLTSALGFGSLVACRDFVIREFGGWAAAGVGVMFVCVLVLAPLLGMTRLVSGRAGVQPAAATARRRQARWTWLWIRWLDRYRRSLTAGFVVLTVGLVAVSLWIRPNYRFTENLPDSSLAVQVLRRCEQRFGGLPLLQVSVGWEAESRLNPRALLDLLIEVSQILQNSGRVRAPTSLVDVLESLPGESGDLVARFRELRWLPKPELERILQADRRQTIVSGLVADAGADRFAPAMDRLEMELAELERRHPGFRLELTGLVPLSSKRTRAMIRDLLASLGTAAVTIFLTLGIAFRSWRWGGVSVLPNLLPLAATAGAVVMTGQSLHYAGVLAFSISLGIAVDDTTHFLSRLQREQRCRPWLSIRRTVWRTFHSLWPVLTMTTVLMVLGFGATFLSSAPTIRSFGGLSCWTLAVALLGDLMVLPTLLLFAGPSRRRQAGR